MAVTVDPCPFSKKNIPIMPLDKVRTKQWLVLGVSAFQCIRVGFLWPKCENFACYLPRSKWASFEKMIFFAKIGIFCKSIASSLSEALFKGTQPYSVGGRIKLIICQIKHELNVIIHEISTSWKNVRWQILYLYSNIMSCFYTG